MNYTRDVIIALIFCVGICRANAQIITTVSGPGNKIHTKNDQVDILPTITNASGVAVDDYGNVYVAEYWESSELQGSIFKFDPNDTSNMRTGVITKGQNIPAPPGHIPYPHGITLDHAGNIYVAGYYSHSALKISPAGKITTVAGCGEPGYSGDNGNAAAARLSLLNGIAVDRLGSIYIADEINNVIRKVTEGGIITTFAGNGAPGYKGDGHPATHSLLNRPYGVAIDKAGNLIFSDTYNNVIRKVDIDGIISTIAGNGKEGYSGDRGPATDAQLNKPAGIAADNLGNIYVADEGNNVVRKIALNGLITTIAGNGNMGYYGDGGQAIAASFSAPRDVAIDPMGNMYIADFGNHVIRKVIIPLPFNMAPVNTLPVMTLPVTIIQMPLAFSQPIMPALISITPTLMARLRLSGIITLPVHVPSVGASPSFVALPILARSFPGNPIPILATVAIHGAIPPAVSSLPLVTIPLGITQTPVAVGVSTPVLPAKEISVPVPVVTTAQLAISPAVVLRVQEVRERAIPVLAAKEFSVSIASVAPPHLVIIPSVVLRWPEIARGIPSLSVKPFRSAIPSVVTAPSFVAIPTLIIQTPVEKIPLLSAVPFQVTLSFPDTLEQPVPIPVIDIPQPEEMAPPPRGDEDRVTVSINPDNTMTITSEKGSYTSFTITNMLGETIIEKMVDAKQTNVDVARLQPGNYYINLKSEKETKTLRFVKEN